MGDERNWVVETVCTRCGRRGRVRLESVTRSSAQFFARVQDGLAHVSGVSLAPSADAGKCVRCGGPARSRVLEDDGKPVHLTIHRTREDGVPRAIDDASDTVPIVLPGKGKA